MRSWTGEELEYLQDRWGSVSIKGIANRLGRSINAVQIKANRIGLIDTRLSGDLVTINQLSKAINLDYRRIINWIERYKFPAKQKVFATTQRTWVVDIDNFWRWADKNKGRIDFSKIEPNILGPEPDWAKKKRQADFSSSDKKFKKKWTNEEDTRLKGLVRSYRYTYPEVAKMLNRSEAAVKRRLCDLGIKSRPVRLNNQVKWKDEEVRLLLDLYEKGYGFNTIAEKVGKSALGCRVYLKGGLDGDLSNYIKGIEDACNKLIYEDDRWIYRYIYADKIMVSTKQEERVEVEIRRMKPEAHEGA